MKKILIFLVMFCFIPVMLFAKTFVLLDPNSQDVDSQKVIVETATQPIEVHTSIAQKKAQIKEKKKIIKGINSQKAALLADIDRLLAEINWLGDNLNLDPNS